MFVLMSSQPKGGDARSPLRPTPRRPSWRRNVDTLGLILSVSFLFSITSHEHPSETGLRHSWALACFLSPRALLRFAGVCDKGRTWEPAHFSSELRHGIPLSPCSSYRIGSLSVEYLGGSHNINTKQGLMFSGPSAGELYHAHRKGLSGLAFLSRSVCAGEHLGNG